MRLALLYHRQAQAVAAMEALALGGEDYTSDIGCRRTEEGNELCARLTAEMIRRAAE